MKRCEGGRGLISVKDCTISESNGLWDYLEKSEEAILKEVVKEDFMVEDFMVKEEGKKEYDRKTKERSEMNWKEKKLYRKFLKLIADFMDSVLRQWLRSGYIKGMQTDTSITAAQDQAMRTNWLKANKDGVDCSPCVEYASL